MRKINGSIVDVGEIRVKKSLGKSRSKRKRMNVIEKNMRACELNENMVWNRERWREEIRVVNPLA